MKLLSAIIFILVFGLISTDQCHYSCQTCVNQLYSGCLKCNDNQDSIRTGSEQNGVCAEININNVNILGIILLILITIICATFPREEIIYFVLFIQTLGLLYLTQILWLPNLHFMLSAFTNLMVFLKISNAYKDQSESGLSQIFKSKIFFENSRLAWNISFVGIINLILIVMMIGIPIFKNIRKQINQQRVHCLPDWKLQKVSIVINSIFLFLIQQTLLGIYLGLTYGKLSLLDIFITVIYFISLLLFIINQRYIPLPFFRSQSAQLNIILSKIIIPVFISINLMSHYVIFLLIVLFLLIDIVLTNKNKNNAQINRLLLYKIYSFLVVFQFTMNYIIERMYNSEYGSKIIGIVTQISIFGLLILFGIQVTIQIYETFRIKKQLQDQQKLAIEMTREQINVAVNITDNFYQINFKNSLQFDKQDESMKNHNFSIQNCEGMVTNSMPMPAQQVMQITNLKENKNNCNDEDFKENFNVEKIQIIPHIQSSQANAQTIKVSVTENIEISQIKVNQSKTITKYGKKRKQKK